jgi:hypothetical protein
MKGYKPLMLLVAAVLIVSVAFISCKKDEGGTGPGTDPNTDIPANPGGVAPATTINNIVPSAAFARTTGNTSRIRINLLGIINPTTGQPMQFTANQTVFVTEDTVLKGIKVTAAGGTTVLTADVVFVVDNSGSMGQEADSVAAKIIAFANYLQVSGLDVRVGCVGHGYSSDARIYGALDLTTAANLQTYLSRSSGITRTVGFTGADSARFATAASTFGHSGGGENSVVGIFFADSLFSWRSAANRVYVIFTDEPTQPGGFAYWSTEGLCSRWTAGRGTIHTVFSEDTTFTSWTNLYSERPWALSWCTGGTTKFIPSSAAGLDLTTLPVTGALANSSLVEFVSANPNVAHTVTITVKVTGADGKTVFQNITY